MVASPTRTPPAPRRQNAPQHCPRPVLRWTRRRPAARPRSEITHGAERQSATRTGGPRGRSTDACSGSARFARRKDDHRLRRDAGVTKPRQLSQPRRFGTPAATLEPTPPRRLPLPRKRQPQPDVRPAYSISEELAVARRRDQPEGVPTALDEAAAWPDPRQPGRPLSGLLVARATQQPWPTLLVLRERHHSGRLPRRHAGGAASRSEHDWRIAASGSSSKRRLESPARWAALPHQNRRATVVTAATPALGTDELRH
jgi:hypothetical protein